MHQLLTESLLLAILGAGLGVPTSYAILAGIQLLLPRYAFAPEVVIRMNVPVLAFSVGIALATGVLFGLWPALRLSRGQRHLAHLMQANARRAAGSVSGRRTHNAHRRTDCPDADSAGRSRCGDGRLCAAHPCTTRL